MKNGSYPQFKRVPVTLNSQEWKELNRLVGKFNLPAAFKSAERIQNPKLWDIFLCREQELLKQRYKNKAKAVSKMSKFSISDDNG